MINFNLLNSCHSDRCHFVECPGVFRETEQLKGWVTKNDKMHSLNVTRNGILQKRAICENEGRK
jgi:hypothetical protein